MKNLNINRRDFIKYSLATLAMGTLNPSLLYGAKRAVTKPILVNIVLDGGADFRHIFSPLWSEEPSSYGNAFWRARASAHNLEKSNTMSLAEKSLEYSKMEIEGTTFGIHPKVGWLKSEMMQGRVALVNNVIGSSNRDHSHSLIRLESGNADIGAHDFDHSGWGGRLARIAGGNVISLSRHVRLFCNAPKGEDWNSYHNDIVISASNSRSMGLYEYDTLADIESGKKNYKWNESAQLSRALSSYYAAKKEEIPLNSPYYKFIQHENLLREFGKKINGRLANIEEPETLKSLYSGDSALNSSYFGKQVRNLYDSLLCQDLLNARVLSMEYGGWDSHKRQKESIEPKFEDIFGIQKGLDEVTKLIAQNLPEIYENLIFVVTSEFGRQLAANGDNGTDHGRGSSVLLIGKPIKGGIYGDMFPNNEIDRFDIPNEDIHGLTTMEQVLAQACNKIESGSGAKIFNLEGSKVEDGVELQKI